MDPTVGASFRLPFRYSREEDSVLTLKRMNKQLPVMNGRIPPELTLYPAEKYVNSTLHITAF
jgi:hypothetical protein